MKGKKYIAFALFCLCGVSAASAQHVPTPVKQARLVPAQPVPMGAQSQTQPFSAQALQALQQYFLHAAVQTPRPLQGKGLQNVYRVSPILYRGAQPTQEGYKTLAQMGIKTVVSLRKASPEADYIESLSLKSEHIPVNPFFMQDKHTRQFLKILSNPQNQPVYVHCLYGSDRTGTMVAAYRIVLENWSRQRAIAEMRDKRFGFHAVFSNLITYLRSFPIGEVTPRGPQQLMPAPSRPRRP